MHVSYGHLGQKDSGLGEGIKGKWVARHFIQQMGLSTIILQTYRSHISGDGPGMHRAFALAHVVHARGPLFLLS